MQHGTDRDIPGTIDQTCTIAPGTPMLDTPGAFIVSRTPAPGGCAPVGSDPALDPPACPIRFVRCSRELARADFGERAAAQGRGDVPR
ncbi:hypothetical protein [Parasphingorhabdus pacifica]